MPHNKVIIAHDRLFETQLYHHGYATLYGCNCVLCRGKDVALDTAIGLRYLHEHDIIHLDLKSPNVLLNSSGQAKLSDVGLARVLSTRTHLSSLPGGTCPSIV